MIATLEPPSPLDQWRQRFGGRRRRTQPRPLAAMGYLANGPVIDGPDRGREADHSNTLRRADPPWALRPPIGRVIPAAASPGASASAAPRSAGSSRTSCSSRSLGPGLPARPGQHGTAGPGPATGPRAGPPRTVSAAAGAGAASPAEALGRIPACRRCQHHRRRAGTGGLRRADRQIAPAPAGTPAPRSLRPDPLSRSPGSATTGSRPCAVFADLERFPRRQVFLLRQLPDDLVGFQDAAEFDFHSGLPLAASSGIAPTSESRCLLRRDCRQASVPHYPFLYFQGERFYASHPSDQQRWSRFRRLRRGSPRTPPSRSSSPSGSPTASRRTT